jgi:outer membrane protein assembly factor BamD (BamD/ComL family)
MSKADQTAEGSGLSREVAALAAVRALLKAGDSPGAIQALDRVAQERPRPVLEQEASALRIEALLSAHRVSDARALAERFLRAHPESPHGARVRALLRAPKAER